MPCWFYDKKDLLNTPSAKDGISTDLEAWYRKDGAKHIIDAGNKLGLRFDTCATGVVYFHRFYMFHSFKEFHRLVTAACCLFLAGKVEETPKKCKDIIKTFRSMLSDSQFAHFGEDPKEEVMTLERILLQTIKFDLMVEHPYAYLLKFARLVSKASGDKPKVQKMVQMAWTFINDSLCTTLCLQWEPEIIAVAVMYLTSRLTKFDITDWQGKPSGYHGKWFEFLVEDVTLDLLEDICHQVLDLYSKPPQPHKEETPSAPRARHRPPVSEEDQTRSAPHTPKSPSTVKRQVPSAAGTSAGAQPMETENTATARSNKRESKSVERQVVTSQPSTTPAVTSYSSGNPYMSKQMYSSSFMSMEGSQSIQSLIGVQSGEELHGRAGLGHAGYSQNNSGGSLQSTSPAYQPPAAAASAAAAGYTAQRSQSLAATTSYRPVASHPAASYAQSSYQSYQHSSVDVTGYNQQSYQSASVGHPPVQHYGGSSSHSHQTPPVSMPSYQSYPGGGHSAALTSSGSMDAGMQRSGYPAAGHPVPSSGYQNQPSASVYHQQQAGSSYAATQPPGTYQGQNPGYQSAPAQQQQQQQQHPSHGQAGMHSNSRRDNWY